MAEINLLRSLPESKRNVKARETAKTEEHIRISREYGEMYFDGPREYGYGGYRYDGRWQPVAKDIVDHFGLKPGDRVLDIGCAKGFLVKDLRAIGIDAVGVDVSEYGLAHAEPEAKDHLQIASADNIPFEDKSFSAVLAINCLHNLNRASCVKAIKEMERLAPPGKAFLQVDSYHTPEQKEIFESWVLTAKFYDYPEGWLKVFEEANYTGDWFWTII
ncbi:MAG: class I SAM-dependent methyltransferase [Rhodospirillales bacterium]|nr:class I SAM-dependent methyltransferase [Rhodospirillales bacterium]